MLSLTIPHGATGNTHTDVQMMHCFTIKYNGNAFGVKF